MMIENEPIPPQVSVIIPLYNKALYIKRTIDSILAQTFQNFEIIIVGGKSLDGSEDIVRKYTDSRIRLIDEVGKGVSAARNQGVDAAISDLVAFLDADDEWYPDHLETILSLKKEFQNAGLCVAAHDMVVDNGVTVRTYLPEKGPRLLKSYFSERVDAGIHNQFIMTSALAVEKQIFQRIGGFNINMAYGEDIDLYERMSIVTKIAYSPQVTVKYNYDIPDNTRTHVVFNKPLTTERIDALWDAIQDINDDELKKDFMKYREMNYATAGFVNALRGHRNESLNILKRVKGIKYIHLIAGAVILNSLPRKIQVKLMMWHYKL